MIEIYKLVGDYNNPHYECIASWESGKFISGFEGKMVRDELLLQFNRGYYRTSEVKEMTTEKIEIDLTPLQKAKQRVYVKPTAHKKGYYRMQEVGQKEIEKKPPRKDTGKIASLPDSMKKEILDLRRLGDSGASIKSQIETMIDASDDPNITYDLHAKGILKSPSGAASLNVTAQALTDWAKTRGVESRKKRKTVKTVEEKSREIKIKQFKIATEKLSILQVENKQLQDELDRERDSHQESDAIRRKLRDENYILRAKLKSLK